MLTRILEPEVMDTVSEAVDYDQMDHSGVNRLFVDDLLTTLRANPMPGSIQIFDAGTGTAQIPLELMRRGLDATVTATDLAEQMLIVAQQNVNAAGFAKSIRLVLADCKQLSDANGTYDVVMSNSIVHHIPEPLEVLAELWRILKPGGLLFVRDLLRPDDQATLDGLVQTYAGTSNGHQQQMFRDSLHAALTVNEVRELLKHVGIPVTSVQATSDRHWTIAATKATADRL
ncbi:MAG TPA: methyltransferase domain-containing protein [Schlesneria sp.]